MVDRKKVLKGLEICTMKPPTCGGCPYYDECKNEAQRLKEDARVLLIEQEKKNGEWITIWQKDDPDISTDARCSICNRISERPLGGYCKWCGAKMNQERGYKRMIDRKKVIKGLETCYCPPAKCEDCPYYDLEDEQKCNDCNDTLCLDALALLKEQEPYKSEKTHLNRDEYCRVGDVLDCFDGMDMKADEVFHAICLIEWAMGKRSVPLSQLLKEQKDVE